MGSCKRARARLTCRVAAHWSPTTASPPAGAPASPPRRGSPPSRPPPTSPSRIRRLDLVPAHPASARCAEVASALGNMPGPQSRGESHGRAAAHGPARSADLFAAEARSDDLSAPQGHAVSTGFSAAHRPAGRAEAYGGADDPYLPPAAALPSCRGSRIGGQRRDSKL